MSSRSVRFVWILAAALTACAENEATPDAVPASPTWSYQDIAARRLASLDEWLAESGRQLTADEQRALVETGGFPGTIPPEYLPLVLPSGAVMQPADAIDRLKEKVASAPDQLGKFRALWEEGLIDLREPVHQQLALELVARLNHEQAPRAILERLPALSPARRIADASPPPQVSERTCNARCDVTCTLTIDQSTWAIQGGQWGAEYKSSWWNTANYLFGPKSSNDRLVLNATCVGAGACEDFEVSVQSWNILAEVNATVGGNTENPVRWAGTCRGLVRAQPFSRVIIDRGLFQNQPCNGGTHERKHDLKIGLGASGTGTADRSGGWGFNGSGSVSANAKGQYAKEGAGGSCQADASAQGDGHVHFSSTWAEKLNWDIGYQSHAVTEKSTPPGSFAVEQKCGGFMQMTVENGASNVEVKLDDEYWGTNSRTECEAKAIIQQREKFTLNSKQCACVANCDSCVMAGAPPVCGNGRVEPGEQCDDGGSTACPDTCDDQCRAKPCEPCCGTDPCSGLGFCVACEDGPGGPVAL